MKIKLLLLALLAALYVTGQNTGVHSYAIDLTHVVEDRVKVTVDASLVQLSNPKDNQYKFHFPATIPGTYATLDYGRFIQDFKGETVSNIAVRKCCEQRVAIMQDINIQIRPQQ